MEAELIQVAREAVVALQTGPAPSWVAVAQLFVSGIGLGCIVWGLFQMQAAGNRRNKEIDVLGRALERQGAVLAELLRRTNPA